MCRMYFLCTQWLKSNHCDATHCLNIWLGIVLHKDVWGYWVAMDVSTVIHYICGKWEIRDQRKLSVVVWESPSYPFLLAILQLRVWARSVTNLHFRCNMHNTFIRLITIEKTYVVISGPATSFLKNIYLYVVRLWRVL